MTNAEFHHSYVQAMKRLIAAARASAGTSTEASLEFEKLVDRMQTAGVREGSVSPELIEILSRLEQTAQVVETLTRGLQGVLDGLTKDPEPLN